ncbi:MAG: hypothetical protein LBS44_00375, partial [Deltaproteobacteria bacterium]|nr:hypothetical protein [Deltaproteobacteria bacterium]
TKVIEELKQRADERYEREMEAYQRKMAVRKEGELKLGKKVKGRNQLLQSKDLLSRSNTISLTLIRI